MHRYLLVSVAMLLAGCAFNHKAYVSNIVVEGKNYRGTRGDEGAFYIDDDPLIRMRMGCYRYTFLDQTMSPIVPSLTTDEAKPHDSIAGNPFSFTLSHRRDAGIDLSSLAISVDIAGKSHPLRLASETTPGNKYSVFYEYVASLRCADIAEATLEIKLSRGRVRIYKLQSKEGVKQEISYQPYFVT